ncbi:MAG: ComF family protein [Deltaproteobacteria bacterium]|nr:ComF family protein [Deltaproteobacteria bacterium]
MTSAFLSLFFPPRCLACSVSILPRTSFSIKLCFDCQRSLQWIQPPTCPLCGESFTGREGIPHFCPVCEREGKKRGFDAGFSAGFYQGSLLALIRRWKYDQKEGIGPFLTSLLGERLPSFWQETAFDKIVPIPLAPSRLCQRGFNPSWVLAKGLSRIFAKPVDPFLLWRQEGGAAQVGLSREERLKNVKRAFYISPGKKEALKGKRVLLVDDVYTTGATLSEASRLLKKEGAEAVSFVTLARTP